MSTIASPVIFKRMSCRFPPRANSINPANPNASTNNSTCPLPQNSKQIKMKDSQLKVSHDITMLYELFSSFVSTKSPVYAGYAPVSAATGCSISSLIPVCLCCERKITSQVCQPNHQQHEVFHNKHTSALFYDSHHVKKYMKIVMTKKNLSNIINHGFPCPHTTLQNTSNNINNIQYHCDYCDNEKKQDTIRLTLKPSHCRAWDNEIYNNTSTSTTPQQKKLKKRRGCIFFVR